MPHHSEPHTLLQGKAGVMAGLRAGGRRRHCSHQSGNSGLQRCIYQACNYEETFPHICAALGTYAQACASQGILLWGWRSSVDNCSECWLARVVGPQGEGPRGCQPRSASEESLIPVPHSRPLHWQPHIQLQQPGLRPHMPITL